MIILAMYNLITLKTLHKNVNLYKFKINIKIII